MSVENRDTSRENPSPDNPLLNLGFILNFNESCSPELSAILNAIDRILDDSLYLVEILNFNEELSEKLNFNETQARILRRMSGKIIEAHRIVTTKARREKEKKSSNDDTRTFSLESYKALKEGCVLAAKIFVELCENREKEIYLKILEEMVRNELDQMLLRLNAKDDVEGAIKAYRDTASYSRADLKRRLSDSREADEEKNEVVVIENGKTVTDSQRLKIQEKIKSIAEEVIEDEDPLGFFDEEEENKEDPLGFLNDLEDEEDDQGQENNEEFEAAECLEESSEIVGYLPGEVIETPEWIATALVEEIFSAEWVLDPECQGTPIAVDGEGRHESMRMFQKTEEEEEEHEGEQEKDLKDSKDLNDLKEGDSVLDGGQDDQDTGSQDDQASQEREADRSTRMSSPLLAKLLALTALTLLVCMPSNSLESYPLDMAIDQDKKSKKNPEIEVNPRMLPAIHFVSYGKSEQEVREAIRQCQLLIGKHEDAEVSLRDWQSIERNIELLKNLQVTEKSVEEFSEALSGLQYRGYTLSQIEEAMAACDSVEDQEKAQQYRQSWQRLRGEWLIRRDNVVNLLRKR